MWIPRSIMTADFGTYFRDNEKWEARGNVELKNHEGRLDPEGAEPRLLPRRCRASRIRAEMFADRAAYDYHAGQGQRDR